jgi:hypothetical protein
MDDPAQQYVTWQSMATFFAATVTTTAVTAAIASLCRSCKPKVIAIFVSVFLIEGFTFYLDFVLTDKTTIRHYIADVAIAAVNSLLVYGSVVGVKTVDFGDKPDPGASDSPKGGGRGCAFCARFNRYLRKKW